MKHTISSLKVEAAKFFFVTPYKLPLFGKYRKFAKMAREEFYNLEPEILNVKADRDFRAYRFKKSTSPTAKGRILVTHGWLSCSYYMTNYIKFFFDAGYEVVALDFPAHGGSRGFQLWWEESVATILEVNDLFGPFDLALGHSYGGSMILNSLALSPSPSRKTFLPSKVILISAPSRIQTPIHLFSRMCFLNEEEKTRLRAYVENRSSATVDDLDFVSIRKHRDVSSTFLVIHDREDPVVPFEDSVRLSRMGESVTLVEKKNLGHIDVLIDRSLLEDISMFLGVTRGDQA